MLAPGGLGIAPPSTGPDSCQEYLDLLVSFDQGITEERAVVTSHGRYPSLSASSILPADSPLNLRLAAETRPLTVDVCLYPGARVSGSFSQVARGASNRREARGQAPPGLSQNGHGVP